MWGGAECADVEVARCKLMKCRSSEQVHVWRYTMMCVDVV